MPRRTSSLGVVSLILGVVAFLLCWIPLVGMLSIPLSALGLLLAAVGFLVALVRRGSGIGYPIGGGIVSGLALAIGIAQVGAVGSALTGVATAIDESHRQQTRTNQEVVAEGAVGSAFSAPDEIVTTVAVGEDVQLGQVLFKPLGAWKGPISLKSSGLYGNTTRQYSEPVLMLAVHVTNTSEGQVFAAAPRWSDPWEICKVTDTHGNRDLASAVCQFQEWPASGQIGQRPTPLKPQQSAVLVFIMDELANPEADRFTWSIDCLTDNQYSKQTVSVVTPANQVQFRRGGGARPKNGRAPAASRNDKPAEPEWASAKSAVRQGDVELRITRVLVGKVPLRAGFEDRETTSQDELLAIHVELTNRSQSKKLEYRSWLGRDVSFTRDYATLKDNFGNSYKRISFGFGTDVIGHTESESIYPGKQLADVLIFEMPVDTAEHLDLELPAKNFGGEGMLRLRIPADMVRHR